MIGEMLYHLHRHFRWVLVGGALCVVGTAGFLAYSAARHYALV